jgi:hypothetical protein
MGVGGQRHAPAALPRYRGPVPIAQEAHIKADRKEMRCEGVNRTKSPQDMSSGWRFPTRR